MEALVSLLVLSVGLLGLAGLQASGLRANQGAYARSQAVVLAQDIGERIRANQIETSTAIAAGRPSAYQSPRSNWPGTWPDCLNNDCSPTAMSQYDIGTWKQSVAELLPGGDASVSQNGRIFTITVFWDEQRTGKVADLKQFTLIVDLGL